MPNSFTFLTFVRSHTNVGQKGLACSLSPNSPEKCCIRSYYNPVQASQVLPQQICYMLFMALALKWLAHATWQGHMESVRSYHRTKLDFTELLRAIHSFTTVCRSSLHTCAWFYKTFGHGSDWNTWIQLFRCVTEYFWQCSSSQRDCFMIYRKYVKIIEEFTHESLWFTSPSAISGVF